MFFGFPRLISCFFSILICVIFFIFLILSSIFSVLVNCSLVGPDMAMITVINNKHVNKRTFHLLWRYLLAWNRNFIFHFAPSIIIFICHSCFFRNITTFVGSRDAMTVL